MAFDGAAGIAGAVAAFKERREREWVISQSGITFENMVRFWEHRFRWGQPGFFFPRSAYESVGGMDEGLHYAMDYDLLCRLLQHCSVTYMERPIATFRLHDSSKTCTVWDRFVAETTRVSERYWHLLEDVDRGRHDRYVVEQYLRLAAKSLWRRPREAMKLLLDAARVHPTAVPRGILGVLRRNAKRGLGRPPLRRP